MITVIFINGSGAVVPLYIYKTETLGKGKMNLSTDLVNLQNDRSKFARWRDNYQYHIGGLSAVMLERHPDAERSPEYKMWMNTLFVVGSARLKQPI